MQVSLEKPSKLERRLTVVVPVDVFNNALNKKLQELTKTAKLDGFRVGKIPLDVIKKRYGEAARQEVLGEVIETSLYNALSEQKLSPITTPMVESKKIIPNEPLEYVATFEVAPEIDTVHFNVKTLEKETATIEETDIVKVLDYLKEQHQTWEDIDGPAALNDRIFVDFTGSLDGKPFKGGEAKNYGIILGKKTMVKGFEEGLVGLTQGAEKTITITFPTDYFAKDLADKNVNFFIKCIRIERPKSFQFDEPLVKKLGIPSGQLEDLKLEIRKNLERELERTIKLKLKNKVFDILLEQNAIELPKALIEREASRIHNTLHPHHGNEKHAHTEAEMEEFTVAAKRNVTLSLLFAELIKKYQIKVDQNVVLQHIKEIAGSYEDPNKLIEWYKKDKEAYYKMESMVLENELVQQLTNNISLTEKMVSYNELIQQEH